MVTALALIVSLSGAVAVTATPASAAGQTANIATVNYWNDVLLEAFRRQGGAPTPLARAAAIMHAGMYDVLISADWERRDGVGVLLPGYLDGDANTSPPTPGIFATVADVDDNLAAGLAARDLLAFALPGQQAFAQQKFTERHGTATQAAASSLATRVVNVFTSARSNDGSGAPSSYTPDGVPGAWRPTGNGCVAAATPHWGNVTPFAIKPPRPALPGGYTTYAALLASSLYATHFNEVKTLGRSETLGAVGRTPDQTQAAFFWANDLDGTYKPPGHLLSITATFVTAGGNHLTHSKMLTRVSLAMADAAVAAWDAKYNSPIDLWRPETAIKEAGTDNNPNTVPDAGWRPLSKDRAGVNFSPCFPAWVSGHATFAAAWAGVMEETVGSGVSFTASTEDPHAVGVTRTFNSTAGASSFRRAATENARSRVYLGVHYQFDADDGLTTGYAVAAGTPDFTPLNCVNPCLQ